MFLLPDTVQATALHREASESGRASPKVHEGARSEGYMGRKDNNNKEIRREGKKNGRWEGCVCVQNSKPNQQKTTHTQKPHKQKKTPKQ